MSSNRRADSNLLRSLLSVLVDEWGIDLVRLCLDDFSSASSENSENSYAENPKIKKDLGQGRSSGRKKTASAMAEKNPMPNQQKELVKILAAKYDEKKFLPSFGDVRYFFESYGEDVPHARQRVDAFRGVLRLLSKMSMDELRKLIDSDVHAGPVSLDPLSDAMRGLGEQLLNERGIFSEDERQAVEIAPCTHGSDAQKEKVRDA